VNIQNPLDYKKFSTDITQRNKPRLYFAPNARSNYNIKGPNISFIEVVNFKNNTGGRQTKVSYAMK